MKHRKFLLILCCLLTLGMAGMKFVEHTCPSDAPCTSDERTSMLTTTDDDDSPLRLLHETSIGYPAEGQQLNHEEHGHSLQLQVRQLQRRQHRLDDLCCSLLIDRRYKHARLVSQVFLSNRHADGHYLYARCQMRC